MWSGYSKQYRHPVQTDMLPSDQIAAHSGVHSRQRTHPVSRPLAADGMKSLIPVLLLAVFVDLPASAQDGMSTDRPDFTESPLTVGQGVIQIEAGATMQSVGDTSELTSGEGLIRYGVRPRFELRFGLPSLVSGEDIDRGLSDINIGFKWTIAQLDNGVDLGLVGAASLPTGDENFTSDDVNPAFIFIASKPVNDQVSLAGQISGSLIKARENWEANWSATAVMGVSISQRLGGFLEIMGESPPLGDNRITFHTGVLYPVSDDFQLDFHIGTGLNDAAGDEFFGLGLAVRR